MPTTITYQQLTDIAYEAGIDTDNIRVGYSGRGMFGKSCVAFDLDSNADLLDLGAALLTVGGTDLFDTFRSRASLDSMGYGIVIYFPGIGCDDAPDED